MYNIWQRKMYFDGDRLFRLGRWECLFTGIDSAEMAWILLDDPNSRRSDPWINDPLGYAESLCVLHVNQVPEEKIVR